MTSTEMYDLIMARRASPGRRSALDDRCERLSATDAAFRALDDDIAQHAISVHHWAKWTEIALAKGEPAQRQRPARPASIPASFDAGIIAYYGLKESDGTIRLR